MAEINYKQLYLDFIDDNSKLPISIKDHLKQKISKFGNKTIPYKDLYGINLIIKTHLSPHRKDKRDQQLNAYDLEYIRYILLYQKKYNLSDRQMGIEFKLSRNTISRWKTIFPI